MINLSYYVNKLACSFPRVLSVGKKFLLDIELLDLISEISLICLKNMVSLTKTKATTLCQYSGRSKETKYYLCFQKLHFYLAEKVARKSRLLINLSGVFGFA